jgi:prephenate dehydratase
MRGEEGPMAFKIRSVDYYYTSVKDEPGAAYRILSQLSGLGVNLLAFTAVPVGPTRAQLALFPENDGKLTSAARQAGLVLDGPHSALLAQGDDELGALAGVHQRLFEAGVDVMRIERRHRRPRRLRYVIYVREDSSRAPRARSGCERGGET